MHSPALSYGQAPPRVEPAVSLRFNTGGPAWPFSVGRVTCLVSSVSVCTEREEEELETKKSEKKRRNEKKRKRREEKSRLIAG